MRRAAAGCPPATRPGEPLAGPQRHGETDRAGRDQYDEQHTQVVLGDEHGLGDRDHAGHHGEYRRGEQDYHVRRQ
jgi:hypothetical protein